MVALYATTSFFHSSYHVIRGTFFFPFQERWRTSFISGFANQPNQQTATRLSHKHKLIHTQYLFKYIIIGDTGVGKSCLIKRYCEDKFVTKHVATIGIDFGVKPVSVDGEAWRVNFFDMAGGPEYFDIRNEFYKDAQGALLVFDVGSKASLDALDK